MSAASATSPSGGESRPNRIAISGASGMVGSALSEKLRSQNRQVLALTRSEKGSYDNAIRWDPASGLVNPGRLESVDAIVHLAGENIAGGRWTDKQKAKIRDSRVQGTRNLVKSIGEVQQRPSVLVCASAIGYYGDRGATELTESADPGSSFLSDVCKEWEAEALAAQELGLRVVCVRIGIVLNPQGGALGSMLLPFKMGVGGKIGSGQQYWSWIGLSDLVNVFVHCLDNEQLSGPVNAVSPNAMTNQEFTKVLGHVLHRPTILPLPGFAARLALGEMANELLMASARVVPKKLKSSGFQFQYPELEACLKHELQS